jgi:hypothetical protein
MPDGLVNTTIGLIDKVSSRMIVDFRLLTLQDARLGWMYLDYVDGWPVAKFVCLILLLGSY